MLILEKLTSYKAPASNALSLHLPGAALPSEWQVQMWRQSRHFITLLLLLGGSGLAVSVRPWGEPCPPHLRYKQGKISPPGKVTKVPNKQPC